METFGVMQKAQDLPISFGMRHAKVAFHALFGIAPLLVA